MKQILKKIDYLKVAQVALVTAIVFAPLAGFAANQLKGYQCDTASGLNCSTIVSVNDLIKTVINWLLGIALGVAVLFLIIGGFWYITSAGNEETAEKGRNTAVNALIGIVIIVLAFVVVNVVANLAGGVGQP